MKLLLTSGGFTNKSITNALLDLAGKPFSQLKLVFVPTAANFEEGGKEWLIDDLYNCKKLGFKQIDICDIAVLPNEKVLKKLTAADIVFAGGGDTYYLMDLFNKKKLTGSFKRIMESKVYVGLSAGSCIAAKQNSTKFDRELFYEPEYMTDVYDTFGFVNFLVIPHFGTSEYPNSNIDFIGKYAKKESLQIYLLDDQSAVKVDGDRVEVVSEGNWKKFD